jgi:hypothetical protein
MINIMVAGGKKGAENAQKKVDKSEPDNRLTILFVNEQ